MPSGPYDTGHSDEITSGTVHMSFWRMKSSSQNDQKSPTLKCYTFFELQPFGIASNHSHSFRLLIKFNSSSKENIVGFWFRNIDLSSKKKFYSKNIYTAIVYVTNNVFYSFSFFFRLTTLSVFALFFLEWQKAFRSCFFCSIVVVVCI